VRYAIELTIITDMRITCDSGRLQITTNKFSEDDPLRGSPQVIIVLFENSRQ